MYHVRIVLKNYSYKLAMIPTSWWTRVELTMLVHERGLQTDTDSWYCVRKLIVYSP